jgi:hypothetical protein
MNPPGTFVILAILGSSSFRNGVFEDAVVDILLRPANQGDTVAVCLSAHLGGP